jgi:endonuclease/exonuclease/phosphatase family metal-dependent hydrolase
MAWGEFTVRSTGKEFAFISTHWDVIYPQNIEQADEFNAKIVELSKGGTRPVMTGGDMNVRVDGVNYQRLMEYGNVNNAKLVTTNLRNDIATCKDIFVPAGDDPVKTIDHIFLTKDVECTMFMTVVENSTIDLSDHNGIMADVKF